VRNYLVRGEQHRLLVLVLMCGLVLLLIGETGRPERWQWLWQLGARPGHHLAAVGPNAHEGKASPRGSLAGGAAIVKPKEERLLPGIDLQALSKVTDDAKMRRDEWPIEFDILRVLSETDPITIARTSIGRVSFIELSEQTKAYRGEVVTIAGRVRRATEVPAGVNDEGVLTFQEVAITPSDKPSEVVLLHCVDLPAGMPQGKGLDEEVEVNAVVFKRLAYQGADGNWLSGPLLLARSMHWKPRPPAPPKAAPTPPDPLKLTLALVGAAVLAIALVAWAVRRKPLATNPYAHPEPPRSGHNFSRLRELEVSPEARDSLARMSGPIDPARPTLPSPDTPKSAE
jgi:hypothetical protein